MKKIMIVICTILFVCLFNFNNSYLIKALTSSNNEIVINSYKNIILFVGDGMGPNHVDAGNIYKGENLVFDVEDENWTYHAYSNTDSRTSAGFTLDKTRSLLRPELNPSLYDDTASPYGGTTSSGGSITGYTDSAAGGSALACGKKLTNSRVGMDIDGTPITNIVEIASSLNRKTGVLTSDNLVGATPSDFLVHIAERHMEEEIIEALSKADMDLFLAATNSTYENNKENYESLFEENGFSIAYSKDELNIESEKIFGLFKAILNREDFRAPSLAELTTFALDYLDNDNGFFLMVEGANIDKKSHANQARLMLKELLGFNEAIEAAMKWAENRNDTLMIVTADHETGALYFDKENTNQNTIEEDINWLSENHSRTRVDIAVYGDISDFVLKYQDEFSTLEGLDYWDNTDIFKLCSYYLTN